MNGDVILHTRLLSKETVRTFMKLEQVVHCTINLQTILDKMADSQPNGYIILYILSLVLHLEF